MTPQDKQRFKETLAIGVEMARADSELQDELFETATAETEPEAEEKVRAKVMAIADLANRLSALWTTYTVKPGVAKPATPTPQPGKR